MTGVQATILAGIIASPLLVAIFEFLRDKILAKIKYSGWQAVFLANSQVYFGKITSINKIDIKLTEIYYLSLDEKEKITPSILDKAGPKLIKLGEELHGPEDFMTIGRNNILFIETLKETGQVVKAIKEHRTQGN